VFENPYKLYAEANANLFKGAAVARSQARRGSTRLVGGRAALVGS
jgi:hypothetical protein